MTGDEAVALGLVNAAVPRTDVLDHATEVAAGIAGNAPIATRLTKVALANGGGMPRTTPRCSGKHWPSR